MLLFYERPEEKSALGLPLSFSDWLADSWHCPLAFRYITSISVSSSCIFTVVSLLLEGHVVITLDEKAILLHFRTSLVAQLVKSLPAMWEILVQFLGQEDPLEQGMATHSSILAWRILWTEKPGWLQSMGWQRVGHD